MFTGRGWRTLSTIREIKLRLGILGFGEAGLRFAQDLSQGGLTDIVAYSRTGAKEPVDGPLHAQATADLPGVSAITTSVPLHNARTVFTSFAPAAAACVCSGPSAGSFAPVLL